jgi:hypothetical protein
MEHSFISEIEYLTKISAEYFIRLELLVILVSWPSELQHDNNLIKSDTNQGIVRQIGIIGEP